MVAPIKPRNRRDDPRRRPAKGLPPSTSGRPASSTTASWDAPIVRLQPGRERSLQHRHPWVFSGAVASVAGEPGSGHTVAVLADDGTFLCRAAYSPHSQIRARAWSFDPEDSIDADFFERRIATAVQARQRFLDPRHTACRLVHGESDGLPGIVVDRYGNALVLQLSSAGADHWRDTIIATLARQLEPRGIYERSDAEVRALEGLAPRNGIACGDTPGVVEMVEDGLHYGVDIATGQKTGFFLDQRDNRRAIRAYAAGRDTLNMFCYTGGFSLAALAGGARSVLSVDSSADALAVAADNLARNPELPQGTAQWREADAFSELRRLRDQGSSFDLIVLDPPKFAPTAQHAEGAARAYKDINLLALKLLRPGGLLATFSCSGGIDAALFRKIVAGAALDARATAVIERTFGAGADHAASLTFPEGEYLKGLLVRRVA